MMRGWLTMMGAIVIAGAAMTPLAAEPPQRFRSQVVYGEDACPVSKDPDEIVVCARQPEGDRYRIPKRLRNPKREDAPVQAWGNRAATLDEAGRVSAGLPDTCSSVGSGGQTGCQRQFLQQFRDEKRADDAAKSVIPGN